MQVAQICHREENGADDNVGGALQRKNGPGGVLDALSVDVNFPSWIACKDQLARGCCTIEYGSTILEETLAATWSLRCYQDTLKNVSEDLRHERRVADVFEECKVDFSGFRRLAIRNNRLQVFPDVVE